MQSCGWDQNDVQFQVLYHVASGFYFLGSYCFKSSKAKNASVQPTGSKWTKVNVNYCSQNKLTKHDDIKVGK